MSCNPLTAGDGENRRENRRYGCAPIFLPDGKPEDGRVKRQLRLACDRERRVALAMMLSVDAVALVATPIRARSNIFCGRTSIGSPSRKTIDRATGTFSTSNAIGLQPQVWGAGKDNSVAGPSPPGAPASWHRPIEPRRGGKRGCGPVRSSPARLTCSERPIDAGAMLCHCRSKSAMLLPLIADHVRAPPQHGRIARGVALQALDDPRALRPRPLCGASLVAASSTPPSIGGVARFSSPDQLSTCGGLVLGIPRSGERTARSAQMPSRAMATPAGCRCRPRGQPRRGCLDRAAAETARKGSPTKPSVRPSEPQARCRSG